MFFPGVAKRPAGTCQCTCGCKNEYGEDWAIFSRAGVKPKPVCRMCFDELTGFFPLLV